MSKKNIIKRYSNLVKRIVKTNGFDEFTIHDIDCQKLNHSQLRGKLRKFKNEKVIVKVREKQHPKNKYKVQVYKFSNDTIDYIKDNVMI